MRTSLYVAGLLEIYRYVPPAHLEGVDVETMGIDEFLTLLAEARYLEEIESGIIQKGIAAAFPDHE